jgi:hypothetical protein
VLFIGSTVLSFFAEINLEAKLEKELEAIG